MKRSKEQMALIKEAIQKKYLYRNMIDWMINYFDHFGLCGFYDTLLRQGTIKDNEHTFLLKDLYANKPEEALEYTYFWAAGETQQRMEFIIQRFEYWMERVWNLQHIEIHG